MWRRRGEVTAGACSPDGNVSENGRLTENGKLAELGAGKNTSSGNFAGAAEEAAASRSAAKGANGAPLGTAGQRGRGEDDEEHQRPDHLLEADPQDLGMDVWKTLPSLVNRDDGRSHYRLPLDALAGAVPP